MCEVVYKGVIVVGKAYKLLNILDARGCGPRSNGVGFGGVHSDLSLAHDMSEVT